MMKKSRVRASMLRNLEALNPLMRKGGVHEKSGKTKRHHNKQKFKVILRQGDFEKRVNRFFSQDHPATITNLEVSVGVAGTQP